MKKEKPTLLFTQTTTQDIATRLRALRKSRGWSLGDVEKLSHGAIKAVVLGSYERSDRSLSVSRAIELANFFGVPLTHLLAAPDAPNNGMNPPKRLVVDLLRAARLAPLSAEGKERARIFSTFIGWIASQRSDWNGQVLSLRRSDIASLALLTFTSETLIVQWLNEEKLLLTERVHS